MGFRSKMMTEDCSGVILPKWFVEKYPELNHQIIEGKHRLSLSDNHERKYYNSFDSEEIFLDLQKIVKKKDMNYLVIVLLHECDGITLVFIYKDRIVGREPTKWKEVEVVEHNYCYGCSEPPKS